MTYFEEKQVPEYCEMAKTGAVVVFDTETTGLEDYDDVVQIAAIVMVDGKEVYSETVYLRNQVPIDGTEAQKVNGITDALLAEKGIDAKAALQAFLDRLYFWHGEKGKVLLVAHNLSFDYRMISNMLERHGLPMIPDFVIGCCTKEFVKALKVPKDILPNNRLCTCIDSLKLDGENRHDAWWDAKACMELFKFLTN